MDEEFEGFYQGGGTRPVSLRDWFAGQAIAGLAAYKEPATRAKMAYELADAMMKVRNQEA